MRMRRLVVQMCGNARDWAVSGNLMCWARCAERFLTLGVVLSKRGLTLGHYLGIT